MSLIDTEAVAPPAVTVRVSVPSVRLSAAMGTEIVALPLASTTALPDNAPPVMSAAASPVREYGTEVPAATLAVVSVKEAIEPSLTELLAAASE